MKIKAHQSPLQDKAAEGHIKHDGDWREFWAINIALTLAAATLTAASWLVIDWYEIRQERKEQTRLRKEEASTHQQVVREEIGNLAKEATESEYNKKSNEEQ